MNDAPGQERLRLINALVAEKVMGWRVCDRTDVQDGTWWADAAGTCIRRVDKFEPTNSWESAGQVVEKMDQLGWGMVHWLGWPLSSAGRGHAVRFYRAVHPPHWEEGGWEEGGLGRSFRCLAAWPRCQLLVSTLPIKVQYAQLASQGRHGAPVDMPESREL